MAGENELPLAALTTTNNSFSSCAFGATLVSREPIVDITVNFMETHVLPRYLPRVIARLDGREMLPGSYYYSASEVGEIAVR